mmetsp:Transcript_4830/g.10383  ORF Transcript_4830/g.10383 Transcript_4830/m.10383 type:complete len:375 (+) Transcript_4830:1094-2218(+)
MRPDPPLQDQPLFFMRFHTSFQGISASTEDDARLATDAMSLEVDLDVIGLSKLDLAGFVAALTAGSVGIGSSFLHTLATAICFSFQTFSCVLGLGRDWTFLPFAGVDLFVSLFTALAVMGLRFSFGAALTSLNGCLLFLFSCLLPSFAPAPPSMVTLFLTIAFSSAFFVNAVSSMFFILAPLLEGVFRELFLAVAPLEEPPGALLVGVAHAIIAASSSPLAGNGSSPMSSAKQFNAASTALRNRNTCRATSASPCVFPLLPLRESLVNSSSQTLSNSNWPSTKLISCSPFRASTSSRVSPERRINSSFVSSNGFPPELPLLLNPPLPPLEEPEFQPSSLATIVRGLFLCSRINLALSILDSFGERSRTSSARLR